MHILACLAQESRILLAVAAKLDFTIFHHYATLFVLQNISITSLSARVANRLASLAQLPQHVLPAYQVNTFKAATVLLIAEVV